MKFNLILYCKTKYLRLNFKFKILNSNKIKSMLGWEILINKKIDFCP